MSRMHSKIDVGFQKSVEQHDAVGAGVAKRGTKFVRLLNCGPILTAIGT